MFLSFWWPIGLYFRMFILRVLTRRHLKEYNQVNPNHPVASTFGSFSLTHMRHKSTFSDPHQHTQRIVNDTIVYRFSQIPIKGGKKWLLTQTVSHPVLWHRIEPTLSGCTLTLHKHNDRPLMSLHSRFRPAHVGSEVSKNGSVSKVPKPWSLIDGWIAKAS